MPPFRRLAPAAAGRVVEGLPPALASSLLSELLPTEAVLILGTLEEESGSSLTEALDPDHA